MKILKLFFLSILFSISLNKRLRFTADISKAPGFFDKINMCVNIWKNIATTFNSRVTNTFEKYLKGKGFDYLRQHTSLLFNHGLDKNKLGQALSKLQNLVRVPNQFRHMFNEKIMEASFIEEVKWENFDILFDKDSLKNDNVDYLNLWSNTRGNKVDLIILHARANFKLAPDIIVMRKNKFIAGGMYQSSVPYNIKVPRGITQKDLIDISDIFTFNMIRLLAMNLGINFQPPVAGH